MITFRVSGLSEAINILTKAQSDDQLVRIVRDVTSRLGVYIPSITPVDTGAMRDSWTWTTVGLTGRIYVSLSAYNPRSKRPVMDYAPIVSERVGLMRAAMVRGKRMAIESFKAAGWPSR